MAHIGEEFGLAAVGELRLFLCGEQVALGALALGNVEPHRDDHRILAVVAVEHRFGRQQHARLAVAVDDLVFRRERRRPAGKQQRIDLHEAARNGAAMRLQRGLADQATRPHPDKRGELAIDQDVAPILAGHADHARNGVDDAQQHLVRLAQAILAPLAVRAPGIRAHLFRSASRAGALRAQEAADPQPEVAVVDRQQQMIGGAGVARAFEAIEILFGADDHDRNLGTGFEPAQPMDQCGGFALRRRGGEHEEPGRIGAAERQRGLGVAEPLGRGPAADRIGEPFEDLQLGGAVIDDDHRLRRHGRSPRIAALLAILDKPNEAQYQVCPQPKKGQRSQRVVWRQGHGLGWQSKLAR